MNMKNQAGLSSPLYSRLPLGFGMLLFVCLFALALPEAAFAEPREVKLNKESTPLSDEIEAGFAHLFGLVRNPGGSFDPAAVAPIIDFVDNCDADPKDFEPKRREGRGTVMRMDLDVGLRRVLEYLYNPDIPNYVIVPSVLRLSGWKEGSDILKQERGLWDRLDDLDKPVVLWGKEFESNTPDSFAGAYYFYDMFRLVVLMKHNGKNVLISVTDQDGESDVGRKGAILDDQNWVYFYSGIEGLDKGLISWMDTYMYASYSVQVFVEKEEHFTRDVLFKWLKAGWTGLNVVKRKHILEGSLRFAESFKKVLESDALPPSEELAGMIRDIRALPDAVIDEKVRSYARTFETLNKDAEPLDKSEFQAVLADGGYAKVLDREQRIGVLVLQKLKCLLGMDTYVDMCGPDGGEPKSEQCDVGATEKAAAESVQQGG
ncbi:hypothetical protein [Salidesulfovibrio onnuriiensis]|uniref:hypothetical protein n=1 Tax=Salidesulfovibrio onnuriiensis TaxID=2583823 RepID=UPI0011CAE2F9|nr:hypothetical protein [Salidesulfovibrio onnuriiensis]